MNAAFNNTGTVEVAGGTLNLQNGGSSTGTLQSDSAATLQFSGGTFNVTGGSLTDNGTLLVSGGTLNIGSGVNLHRQRGDQCERRPARERGRGRR